MPDTSQPALTPASAPGPRPPRRWWRRALISIAILAVVIQLVPYGRSHDNPPTTAAIRWDTAATEQLFMRSCADCHSNMTKWPWYSNIAPASWLIQRDVDEGRGEMNISDASAQIEIDELEEMVREGEMPPRQFTIIHRNATLTDAEKQALIDGIRATFVGRLVTDEDAADRE